ncbi:MAG: biotin/lipoyl-binding protein [Defluviicoccus sp.]|nr:biotin/lipoyl-binding protein [Defluviicoccus sp.]MDG4608976.1 biotin/lipoyl-binding protein [Defluviicoccus sp.]
MLRHLRITVDGKPYDVVVEDMTESGGSLYPAPGVMPPVTAPVASAPAAPVAAPRAPAAAGGSNDRTAPLGGTIQEIVAKVGDVVKTGDKVIVIEAMKMKTSVTAHKDGTVSSIAVKVGDAVESGQVLLTIA